MRLGLNGRFHAAPATGVQRFAREIAARLPALADGVVLLLPRGARAADAPAPVHTARGRLAGHAWEQLELPWRARAARCDVVLHPANTAPVAGGPHVLVVHDALALTHPEWFAPGFARFYRHVQRRAARRAAAVVTVSEWARAEVAAALGLDPARIAVVGQGVEPFDRPAGDDDVRRVRARFGLPDRYLLALGDGDPRKNHAFLDRVRQRWRATRGEPPALVIVGAPTPRVHGRAAAGPPAGADGARALAHDAWNRAPAGFTPTGGREAGGPDDVAAGDAPRGPVPGAIRVGRVDDNTLRALYTGAAAFCFPSRAEGFGRPPLEAMACGAPVIAAPYGPAHEVLGHAARIVPLEPDAWIEALEPLIEPGPARDAAREAGRRHAAAFRWDEPAERLLEICRRAATRRNG